MVSRTLVVLAKGPGAEMTHDLQPLDISRGNTSSKPFNNVKVAKTVWSSCVESALEYTRLINELHSGSTRSNIMLAASGQGASEAILAYKWGAEQQTMAAYTSALYTALQASGIHDPRAV
eukprot:CAMPEP_0179492062 /NCGR_PEP_ID=MMETSP0799-20121207/66532_1 /TAXON_ID=46947 /ORGANISM="Geminigera cryophila, Strain CCMP2564" /LENGTH=119 /DNA_ID=CAMNT_0021308777 /DNA_START=39 /DNA_END=394 /DNA_ORIENTATION=-